MRHILCAICLFIFISCGETSETEKITTTDSNAHEQKAETPTSVVPSEDQLKDAPVLASLDNGYILRVHELIKYLPKPQKPGSIFEPLDANFDYYVADVSIENPTADPKDPGADMLAVYFSLNDGSNVNTGLKSASLLAQYFTDYSRKYPKKSYDKIWSSKFPAHDQSRSEVFAIAVPKGQTVTGIGMYQKNKTKNKYVAFN